MDITNIQSQSVFNNYIWIANPFLNCGGLQIRHINNGCSLRIFNYPAQRVQNF